MITTNSGKFLHIIGNKMTLLQLFGQHRGKYVVYDENGTIVIITRNKNIAQYYEHTIKTAASPTPKLLASYQK